MNRTKPTFFGLSTYDEMCSATILIYPGGLPICSSNLQMGRHIAELVGTKVQADQTRMAGGQYANKTWQQVANMLPWNQDLVSRYQNLVSNAGVKQTGLCLNGTFGGQFPGGQIYKPISVPKVRDVKSFYKSCKLTFPPIVVGAASLISPFSTVFGTVIILLVMLFH